MEMLVDGPPAQKEQTPNVETSGVTNTVFSYTPSALSSAAESALVSDDERLLLSGCCL
jgi:hypothetical protein